MDFNLSREHQLVRKMMAEFTENEVKPIAAETDKTSQYPRENIEKLFNLGVMGMCVPKEYGGAGADEGVLVSAREFGGSDTYATSQILAAAISTIGVEEDDIVMCGRQAIDGDTAQVGPQIAEKLHLPQVTYAADITKDGNTITVKRMLEDGYMTIKVKTPCLLTCIKELNEPRYMSIDGIYATYNKPLETFDYEKLKDHPLIDATTIGLKGSPTNIFKSFTPPQKGAGKMLEGAGKETCEELASILAAKHII